MLNQRLPMRTSGTRAMTGGIRLDHSAMATRSAAEDNSVSSGSGALRGSEADALRGGAPLPSGLLLRSAGFILLAPRVCYNAIYRSIAVVIAASQLLPGTHRATSQMPLFRSRGSSSSGDSQAAPSAPSHSSRSGTVVEDRWPSARADDDKFGAAPRAVTRPCRGICHDGKPTARW